MGNETTIPSSISTPVTAITVTAASASQPIMSDATQFQASAINIHHSEPSTVHNNSATNQPTHSFVHQPPPSHISHPATYSNVPYPYAVSSRLQLPPFNKSDPSLWFIQAEEQFNLARIITEDARYSYTVSSLPAEVSGEVRDVLANRPPNAPYTTLKSLLIQRLSCSLNERIKRLLHEEKLGDKRPTQLLVRMKTLLSGCSGTLDERMFKELFVERLPDHVNEILSVVAESTPIQQLAEMADRMMRVRSTKTASSVNAITQPEWHSPPAEQASAAAAAAAAYAPLVSLTPHAPLHSQPPTGHYSTQPLPQLSAPNSYSSQLQPNVNAISSQNTLDTLVSCIKDLSIQVKDLANNRSRSKSRNRSPHYQRSRSSSKRNRHESPVKENRNYCYYHNKFGPKARKCYTEYCTWDEKSGNFQGSAP